MRVLVTGATGFIGSHLCYELKKREFEVVALCRNIKPWRWLDEALEDCIMAFGDVTNQNQLRSIIARYEVDQIYHLAAHSIVKTAYKDPVGVFHTNIIGTANILEVARQTDIEKVLVMSTDKVYGNQENVDIDAPLIPTEPYGTSKICQDLIAQTFINTYGMKIIIPRSCNAYGYDLSNRIIPNTIRACLKGESPIIYKGEKSKRQYIYIEDLVDALIHLMLNHNIGIFNIATQDILTQEQVVKRILEFFPHLKPRYVPRKRYLEIKHQSMKCTVPNWKPAHSFEEGIEKTIAAFKKWGF